MRIRGIKKIGFGLYLKNYTEKRCWWKIEPNLFSHRAASYTLRFPGVFIQGGLAAMSEEFLRQLARQDDDKM